MSGVKERNGAQRSAMLVYHGRTFMLAAVPGQLDWWDGYVEEYTLGRLEPWDDPAARDMLSPAAALSASVAAIIDFVDTSERDDWAVRNLRT